MRYFLEQGPTEQIIIRQALRERQPLPDAIQNAPSLLMGLELYWEGYMDLMDSRQAGFGIGPISWIAIISYCVYHRLTPEQTESMQFHIRSMDQVYLAHQNRKD